MRRRSGLTGRRHAVSHRETAPTDTPITPAASVSDRPLAIRIRRASPLCRSRRTFVSSSACLLFKVASVRSVTVLKVRRRQRDVKPMPLPKRVRLQHR